MKRILIVLMTILINTTIALGALINVQGVLRDANNKAVADGSYSIIFRIYDAETSGELKHEGPQNVDIVNGVYSITLDVGSSLNDSDQQWLSLQVSDDLEMSRVQLHVSPYEQIILEDGDDGQSNVMPASGNVGIGTTSPGYKLHVKDTQYPLYLESDYGYGRFGAANSLYFHFFTDRPQYYFDKGLQINGGLNTVGDADFSGNVGIGTSSPTNKLSVVGDADFTGNVGIGTTSPDSKFHLYDNTSSTYPLKIETPSGYGRIGSFNSSFFHFDTDLPGFNFNKELRIAGDYSSGGDGKVLELVGGNTGGSTMLTINNYTSNDPQGDWWFDPGVGGKITLGTSDGTTQLQQVLIDGALNVISVDTYAGSSLTWNSSTGRIGKDGSSRRYKQNINEWNDHRSILNANVKKYQMKAGFGVPGQSHIGLIAEELHDIGLNQLVIYDQENRPDAVLYNRVSLYLLGVVKEQQNTIEEQAKQLLIHEDRLALLEDAVAELK